MSMNSDPEKKVSTYQHLCEILLTDTGIMLDVPLRSVRIVFLLAFEQFHGRG